MVDSFEQRLVFGGYGCFHDLCEGHPPKDIISYQEIAIC